ncbi:PepSY domain-containing protein [Microbacterium sp. Leaf179]|uniref:PepSY domain-containing protein n=1 Tax=Microbacterium sp. Leaf179 TaxID=1736288 RepID=UPI0006FD20E0|nr:PepSY domain-containing protein [Microbacterium sp. Leaf179]KQR88926.1 hypothetical protein ASF96_04000 [Microbacterium sp. Leaf179]
MDSTRIPGITLLAVVSALALSSCTPAPGGANTSATDETAIRAANTAEADAGGRAFALDRGDDDSWEVHVAVGDREVEVHLASDGATVQSRSDDDGIDADERAALDAAVTTLADAVRIAAAQNPGGDRIDEVQLDDDGGDWSWTIEMQSGAVVRISAGDGAVVSTGR